LNNLQLSPSPSAPLPEPTVYTQVSVTMLNTSDPPKSPLKRGTKSGFPPFSWRSRSERARGVRGDRVQGFTVLQTCVYTVAPRTGEGSKESLIPLLPPSEKGLGDEGVQGVSILNNSESFESTILNQFSDISHLKV
jgi:hypothetical protein